MKLKLESEKTIAILSAAESVRERDVLVLRAGLQQMIKSGKRKIVLDLTFLPENSLAQAVALEIASFPGWALDQDARLMIASTQPGVGQATSRGRAVELATSKLGGLLALECKLKTTLSELQKKKSMLEGKLSAASPDLDVNALRRKNSDLKLLVRSLEEEVREMLTPPTQGIEPGPVEKERMQVLRATIDPILIGDGLMSAAK